MAVLPEPIKQPLDLKNYINGEWVESKSRKFTEVVNPATRKLIARAPVSTADEVNAAVKAAADAFPEWRRTTPLARVR
jgi:malonate-semialdehyde dehydrogenase (acetylating) / methylmalonate-semialdehyde dehydrogenase